MKHHSEVGKRPGRPAYRTPSFFRGKHIAQAGIRRLRNKRERQHLPVIPGKAGIQYFYHQKRVR